MEKLQVSNPRQLWPSLFENKGWLDKFFNFPLDEYVNFGRVMEIPPVNVNEGDEKYVLTVAAPGLEKKDFDVKIENGMMTISAEKEEKEQKDSKDGKVNRCEYNYSSWSRTFTMPEDVEDGKVHAEYKNGELKIEIPRNGKKIKTSVKSIEVS